MVYCGGTNNQTLGGLYMLTSELNRHLKALCQDIGARPVGSRANQQAAGYVADFFAACGLEVTTSQFHCWDWQPGPCTLSVNGQPLHAAVSPYSLPCDYTGSFVTASTIAQLAEADCCDRVLVLHGELCREPLMPKDFVFYNPEHHQEIMALLEEKAPAAVVALTGRHPELAAAWYPFPLFEDGDFDIPSCFLTAEAGQPLLSASSGEIQLSIDSVRRPSHGCNVAAVRKGTSRKRIVVCAHLDTKPATPGALDNATGVSVLLGLASALSSCEAHSTVELLAVNGEDHYSQAGQMHYLAQNPDLAANVALCINVDGAGLREAKTSYTLLEADNQLQDLAQEVFAGGDFVAVDPWYQGDHMIFVMQGIPACALSTERLDIVTTEIAHTERDTLANVDVQKVVDVVQAAERLVHEFHI